eukprot:21910_1
MMVAVYSAITTIMLTTFTHRASSAILCSDTSVLSGPCAQTPLNEEVIPQVAIPAPSANPTSNPIQIQPLSDALCPKPGESCTNDNKLGQVNVLQRCCGSATGTAKCHISDKDPDIYVGTCCIQPTFEGCVVDNDCCGSSFICTAENICLKKQKPSTYYAKFNKNEKQDTFYWKNALEDDVESFFGSTAFTMG